MAFAIFGLFGSTFHLHHDIRVDSAAVAAPTSKSRDGSPVSIAFVSQAEWECNVSRFYTPVLGLTLIPPARLDLEADLTGAC